jgi:hypothetical protein
MVDKAVLDRFGGLSARLGEYRLAAIDAYMKEQGWVVDGSDYTYPDTLSTYTVARPGADGEGGGKGSWSNDLPQSGEIDMTGEFNTVRERCDNVWSRWLSYNVDQASAEKAVDALAEALAIMAAEGTVQDGNSQGTGLIGVDFDDLENLMNNINIEGGLFDAFRSEFLLKLRPVSDNLAGLIIKVGGAAMAELGLWAEQKCAAVLLFEDSLDKLKATTTSTDADWSVFFKITGWAIAGAACFISGGTAATVIGAAGVANTILSDVTKTDAPAPEAKYSSIMGAVEKTKSDLVTAIDAELGKIGATCDGVANIGDTGDNTRARYQIDDPATKGKEEGSLHVTDGSQLAQGISFQLSSIKRVWTTILPHVSTKLTNCNSQLAKAEYPHDGWFCGGLPTGNDSATLASYDSAIGLLIELVSLLKQDVENAAANLDLGVRDLNEQNAASQSALDGLQKKIKDQFQNTPWDGIDNHQHQPGDEVNHPPPPHYGGHYYE